MKNSKEYSAKIRKLYLSLKKKCGKPRKISYGEPLDAVVYGIVSRNVTESAAQAAIKRFNDYFVDLNDLRVSRVEEIAEMLGVDIQLGKNIAVNLLTALKAVFEKFNIASLEALKKMPKRPARSMLEKFIGDNRFVIDYCMLTALKAHAIPLTNQMIEFLKSNQLVDAEANHEEIEGFLARQVSAENAYEFYALLRRFCEGGKIEQAKPKARAARKTKKVK
jgi:endonuclease III